MQTPHARKIRSATNLCKVICLTFITIGLSSKAQTSIKYNDARLSYLGRIAYTDEAAKLIWSGTAVTVNFTGTDVKATMADAGYNFVNVIIDGTDVSKLQLIAGKQLYTLAAGLKPGVHSLQIFKRTEFADGSIYFFGFEFNKGATILPPSAPLKRKMEFFGNSITCGYGVEDPAGNSYLPPYENNYLSYANITARHYNAQYSCIAKSGIGLLISGLPAIMPDIYNLTDPNDPTSIWNFSKYQPDVVLINLFQNDSWLVMHPEHPQFKARFGTTPPTEDTIVRTYANFVSTLRSKYPNAHIICALGSMDATRPGSVWPGYIEKAVASLGDKKVYTCFFNYKGTPGHPVIKEQQDMANQLIAFIDAHIKW